MPPIQKRSAETTMTLPGLTIEEEFCRRNTAIDAVATSCHFQEGGAAARPRARLSARRASPTPSKGTNPQLAAAEAEKQALSSMATPWPQVAAWPNDPREQAAYLRDYLKKALLCIDSAGDQPVPKPLVKTMIIAISA
ncbi:hypothetical protein IFR04_006228 [Cadophora malorum]|uniref:Uncharacterized protein n=1 Tax=Cadophora malorum TaxID=108018 RepID=A0A8H7TKW3_9HELO|nr:hypothetical protein IFR04_006228 [Cadophora malorum]